MALRIEGLTRRFGGVPAVSRLSLDLAEGELLVVLGLHGAGKSTLLRLLAGRLRPDEGRVVCAGRDITSLAGPDRGIALIAGLPAAPPWRTPAHLLRSMPAEHRARILEVLGLAGLVDRRLAQLDPARRWCAALAHALAGMPQVLLLDDPCAELDPAARAELRRRLQALQHALGLTILVATSSPEEAFALGERLAVMHAGRLVEIGRPDELYLRPQTELVATMLGAANLLVGQCGPGGVQLGALQLALPTTGDAATHRVQVLVRPEDVALSRERVWLDAPALALGEVQQLTFAGPLERIRVRLPPLDGVRMIAPPPPFGGGYVLIEATRPQDQARRMPLHPGDPVWVGVRRFHALPHPGLSLVLVSDGAPDATPVLEFGAALAHQTHARVTLLAYGPQAATARNQALSAVAPVGGLAALEARALAWPLAETLAAELERQPHDLVVAGRAGLDLARELPGAETHVLLVPGRAALPARVLVCAAVGEPGKDDIAFTGRLVRHLGAEATVLTVLPADADGEATARADRFLQAGVRTLAVWGVPASACLRYGDVLTEIGAELSSGSYGLLVLGAALRRSDTRAWPGTLVARLLHVTADLPVLVVRSALAAGVPRLVEDLVAV